MTLAEASSMVISPDSFDPPLKRIEAAVPGYWTVEELAEELEVSKRYVSYLIKGNSKVRIKARLKAYKASSIYLVPDADALEYFWSLRHSK